MTTTLRPSTSSVGTTVTSAGTAHPAAVAPPGPDSAATHEPDDVTGSRRRPPRHSFLQGHRANNPHWLNNVVADPNVEAEFGKERLRFQARVAHRLERHPIWQKQKSDHPGFAAYEASTARQIPVVILEPRF